MSEILDSGTRREFSSGAVRDMASGKGRMDLLPWAAIMEVSISAISVKLAWVDGVIIGFF